MSLSISRTTQPDQTPVNVSGLIAPLQSHNSAFIRLQRWTKSHPRQADRIPITLFAENNLNDTSVDQQQQKRLFLPKKIADLTAIVKSSNKVTDSDQSENTVEKTSNASYIIMLCVFGLAGAIWRLKERYASYGHRFRLI